MNDLQNEKFKFVNNHDPSQADQLSAYNPKNRFAQFDANFHSNSIFQNFSWNSRQISSLNRSKSKQQAIDPQQAQKDKKIKKLTKVNKHLLEKLKQLNDDLTKKLQKQKFRIPKKSHPKNTNKNQQKSKQLQGIKKQLQNSYNQIDFYKQTISLLKAKQLPSSEQDKIIDQNERLRLKNEDIEKIQHEISVQKSILSNQQKQLSKVKNTQMSDILTKLNEQITIAKTKLKEMKKNSVKKQELQKKQHAYLHELESLMKKAKISQDQIQQQQNSLQYSQNVQFQDLVPQTQWQEARKKLTEQKKKYEQYGKKVAYHNYMKSKLSKNYQQLELKYKQKSKLLQKLNAKMNEVNKLVRLKPKIELSQRVNLKMEKLKDIIDRQSTIQLSQINKIKSRALSQNPRQFKKWEVQHALMKQNSNDDEVNEQKPSRISKKKKSQQQLEFYLSS